VTKCLNLPEEARLWDTQNMLGFAAGDILKVVAFVVPKIVGGAMALSPLAIWRYLRGLKLSQSMGTDLLPQGYLPLKNHE
jgi:hypothetical protein